MLSYSFRSSYAYIADCDNRPVLPLKSKLFNCGSVWKVYFEIIILNIKHENKQNTGTDEKLVNAFNNQTNFKAIILLNYVIN